MQSKEVLCDGIFLFGFSERARDVLFKTVLYCVNHWNCTWVDGTELCRG